MYPWLKREGNEIGDVFKTTKEEDRYGELGIYAKTKFKPIIYFFAVLFVF